MARMCMSKPGVTQKINRFELTKCTKIFTQKSTAFCCNVVKLLYTLMYNL